MSRQSVKIILFFAALASPASAGTCKPMISLSLPQRPYVFVIKQDHCLLFQETNWTLFPNKRGVWLIDGATGDLLAEFYDPFDGPWQAGDRGLCTFRGSGGSRFPVPALGDEGSPLPSDWESSECTWAEWQRRADQDDP